MAFAVHSWPLLLPSFSLSLLFLSYIFLRLLLLTHFGETPRVWKFVPQYFGITRRYIQKKNLFEFCYKKNDFLFTASVRSWRPGPPLVPGLFTDFLVQASSLEAKLAIDFFLFLYLFTSIAFHPLRGNSRSEAGHCFHLLFTFFFLFLLLLLSFYVYCFSPTSGIFRKLKFSFISYFCITIRNINKNKSFKKKLYCFTNKADFQAFFLLFTASIRSRSLDQL